MSFFKNLFGKIFGGEEKNKSPQGLLDYGDTLKHADVDYKFAQLFTLSGGVFNYCGNEAEALPILHKIINSENITSVFCCDEDLQKFLDATKTSYTKCLDKRNDAAFITCEYLIAFDAKIVLSCDNILHFSNQMLPEKIIIMANVSQIVEDLSEAMSRIKRKSHIKKITSISGGKSNLDNPNKKYPKLFLLLLED